MAKVVRFNRVGGADVLELVDIEVFAPEANEVQIDVK